MNLGWVILILFLIGYATLSSAIVWHLNTYSFSRKSNFISTAFIICAVILGLLSLLFFSRIELPKIDEIFRNTPKSNQSI